MQPILIQMQAVTDLITALVIGVIVIIMEVRAHIKMRISTALFTNGCHKVKLYVINPMKTVTLGEHTIHLLINHRRMLMLIDNSRIIIEKIITIMKMRDIMMYKLRRKHTITTMGLFQIQPLVILRR